MVHAVETTGIDLPSLRLIEPETLSVAERHAYEALLSDHVSFRRGERMMLSGDPVRHGLCILKGWAISYRITAAGRRQIVAIDLPGDFIGLETGFTRRAILTTDALTDVEAAQLDRAALREARERHPRLAALLDWSVARSSNILGEHNVSLGARSAEERILHLLLELWCRLSIVREAGADGFDMRMTQEQIADAMGLTTVHTNRSLSALRKRGLVQMDGRRIRFPKLQEAMRAADFDPAFLEGFRGDDDGARGIRPPQNPLEVLLASG